MEFESRVRIFHIESQEYHMVGEYVAVTRATFGNYKGDASITLTSINRAGFGRVGVNEDQKENEIYYVLDTSNWAYDYIAPETAIQISNELLIAVKYLNWINEDWNNPSPGLVKKSKKWMRRLHNLYSKFEKVAPELIAIEFWHEHDPNENSFIPGWVIATAREVEAEYEKYKIYKKESARDTKAQPETVAGKEDSCFLS
jgi:hypothetical protein